MSRLRGKRAIITGAASGIGSASAQLFAAEGASVMLVDQAEAGLVETAAQIKAAGGTAHLQQGDVGDEAFVSGVVDACRRELGGLEVFFANAGIGGSARTILELDTDDWLPVLRVNLLGPFLAIKYGAKAMGEGGGSIICTASVAGLRSGAGGTPYSASKAGVMNLVQTAAQQLTGTGVRVNAICPGLIETGLTQVMFDAARAAGKERKIGQLNPLKRAGAADEIATAALFLASDEASYVNGQSIVVDGGLSSSHPFVPGRIA
jgi:NAD(P)-dependent dehydrogenase (short-subunit alcohol dehydrogenase family)